MPLFEGRRHTNKTGDITEHAVMYRLLEAGYGVLKPVGQMYRYDLVIEDSEGQFWRVQCKTGWLHNDGDVIQFAVASTYNHNTRTKGRKSYHGEVEYFGVYVEALRKVYLVPADRVENCHNTATLRLVPSESKQLNNKNIRWAADYEI